MTVPTPAPPPAPASAPGAACQFCGYPADDAGADWICPECGAGPNSRSTWQHWTGQRSRWVAIGAWLMTPMSLLFAFDQGWRLLRGRSSPLENFVDPSWESGAGIGTWILWTLLAAYAGGALLAFANYAGHMIDRRTFRLDRNGGLIACIVHALILLTFLV